MLNPYGFLKARNRVRYSTILHSIVLEDALAKFGLKSTSLFEIDEHTAWEILADLLWVDMAYRHEFMPEQRANDLAEQIISDHSDQNCKYFSNRENIESNIWKPLTTSTFDSGIVIAWGDGNFFCIWFEDED